MGSEGYKPSSLRAHIAKTKDGAKSDTNRANKRAAPSLKNAAADKKMASLFPGNDDDEDSEDDSSSDSSDDEGPDAFLAKLNKPATNGVASAPKKRSKDDEVADSDVERQSKANKKKSSAGGASLKKEAPKSSSESSSESDSDSDSSSDSDSEEAQGGVKVNGGASTKAKAKKDDLSSSEEDSSSESGESDSDSDDKGKTSKATAGAMEAPKAVTSDDESSDTSSDSESEAGEVSVAKPTANGTSAKTTSSESSDEESSDEEEEAATSSAKQAQPKKPEPKKILTEVVESSSESEDEDEDEDEEMADESMQIADRQQHGAVPNFIAPDFILRKSEDGSNGEDIASICNKASLEGKQLWYFTVPENVPVSVIQSFQLPMDQDQRSAAGFSHDGGDYEFSFPTVTSQASYQILIPNAAGPHYKSSPRQIDQVMHVKRVTQHTSTDTAGPQPPAPARAQPEGLRARYKPIGVYDSGSKTAAGTSGQDDDVEMADAPIVFKKDKKEKKDKKSKKAAEATPNAAPEAATKERKRKQPSSEDEPSASKQLQEEAVSSSKKSKKRKTDRQASVDLGSEPSSFRKETPILPPSIPSQPSASSIAKLPSPVEAATPASKKSKKSKKDKSNGATPTPSAEAPQPASSAVKSTPVPLPTFPGSSQHQSSPMPSSQPIPVPKAKKSKSSKSKEKDDSAVKPPSSTKVSAVPLPPAFNRSSS